MTDKQRAEHAVLVAYLKAKVEVGDWHAVSDAANDLRVLEASTQVSQRRFTFDRTDAVK